MMIDAHVHVWTDDFERYPIADGYTVAEMQPPVFTPEELLAHRQPAGVARVVLVQMSYYGTDNSYMLDTMARFPGVFSGTAVIDELAADIEVEMERLGGLGVRSFRIEPRKRSFDGYARMFSYAELSQQALCCLMNPVELPALERMCEQYPDATVVIDHLCRIGVTGEIVGGNVKALCAMARYPNVKVKVSAFYALGKKQPPHTELLPLISKVYDVFGARRLMWGSDCPYQVQDETYEQGLALVRDWDGWKNEEDQAWVLGKTAEETLW